MLRLYPELGLRCSTTAAEEVVFNLIRSAFARFRIDSVKEARSCISKLNHALVSVLMKQNASGSVAVGAISRKRDLYGAKAVSVVSFFRFLNNLRGTGADGKNLFKLSYNAANVDVAFSCWK